MTEIVHSCQNILMAVCLWALGLIACFALLVWSGAFNDLCRKWCGMSPFNRVFLVLSVAFMTLTGATKGWNISFDGGIKQNAIQPSNVTNNLVEIHWMRDTSQGVYVPESAAVFIDYRLITDTNGVWQSLGETTVGAWLYSTMLPNATNYNYNVWAYYIPPEPVHTNGVWVYKTLKDRNDKYAIPLRTRIEVDGKAIATPKEKRKDEGND